MDQNKQLPLENTDQLEKRECKLVLYNDDVNTFDFVIETLVEVCNHDVLQAEQCAMITHFKGQCVIKTGSYSYLKPMHTEILERKLSAGITADKQE